MDTNKIEKVLLDRELENISKQLETIAGKIKDVFSKYGEMKGDHAEELHNYIVENVLSAGTDYFAGHTTFPQANTHPNHIPECVKKLVLDWAVEDFLGHIEEVTEVVEGLE